MGKQLFFQGTLPEIASLQNTNAARFTPAQRSRGENRQGQFLVHAPRAPANQENRQGQFAVQERHQVVAQPALFAPRAANIQAQYSQGVHRLNRPEHVQERRQVVERLGENRQRQIFVNSFDESVHWVSKYTN